VISLFAHEEFLSKEKLQILMLQEQKAKYDANFLKKNWIHPIIISYEKKHNDTLNTKTRTKIVSIDQPIFQFGGILYAIKYADSVKENSLAQVKIRKRELIAQAIELLFEYQKTKKLIQKQKLLLENNYIEIQRKQEQYLSGLIDSSDLDRALLEKNQNSITLVNLEQSLMQIKNNFEKISDLSIESAVAPKLVMINQEEYRENNIELFAVQSAMMSQKYQSKITLTKYLPEVSVVARYSDINTRLKEVRTQSEYGIKISMPLSLNSYDDFQSQRVEYLKRAVELTDQKRLLDKEYENIVKQIEFVDKKIALSLEDEAMYENLLLQTRDQVFVGTQTKYDLQTMQNSLRIKQLDKEIYEIDKNILLLQLYIKTYISR